MCLKVAVNAMETKQHQFSPHPFIQIISLRPI